MNNRVILKTELKFFVCDKNSGFNLGILPIPPNPKVTTKMTIITNL